MEMLSDDAASAALFERLRDSAEVVVTVKNKGDAKDGGRDNGLSLVPPDSPSRYLSLCVTLPPPSDPAAVWGEAAAEMVAAQLLAARTVQVGARISWRILGKVTVAKRVFEAFRRKWHRKKARRRSNLACGSTTAGAGAAGSSGQIASSPVPTPGQSGSNAPVSPFGGGTSGMAAGTGSAALMELGVTTGLTLVFALLKQNWANAATAPGSGQLSSEVLRSALTVLRTLPPLSLSPSVVAIPRVGQNSLEQITDFLARCARISETGDEQGSRLCVEILLCLAVLRGSLLHMLLWIGTCLNVLRDEGRSAKISADVVNMALEQIRRVTGHCREGGQHVARYNLARSAAEIDGLVDLYEGVQCVTAEVRAQVELEFFSVKAHLSLCIAACGTVAKLHGELYGDLVFRVRFGNLRCRQPLGLAGLRLGLELLETIGGLLAG